MQLELDIELLTGHSDNISSCEVAGCQRNKKCFSTSVILQVKDQIIVTDLETSGGSLGTKLDSVYYLLRRGII